MILRKSGKTAKLPHAALSVQIVSRCQVKPDIICQDMRVRHVGSCSQMPGNSCKRTVLLVIYGMIGTIPGKSWILREARELDTMMRFFA